MNSDPRIVDMYIDLLKKCLTGSLHAERFQTIHPSNSRITRWMPRWLELVALRTVGAMSRMAGIEIMRRVTSAPDPSIRGRQGLPLSRGNDDWP